MPKALADMQSLPDPTRRRWTRQEARAVMAKLKASGMSEEEFAAREGLKPERVARWRRRLEAAREPASAPTLIEVRPAVRRKEERDRIELVLPSGHVLFFAPSLDATSLRRVLDVVGSDTEC